jgi:RNA polymerase primary sigma factor
VFFMSLMPSRKGRNRDWDDGEGVSGYIRSLTHPLLTRAQERHVAMKVEVSRNRYRRAVYAFPWAAREAVEVLRRVLSGELPVERICRVSKTEQCGKEEILAKLPSNLKTLDALLSGKKRLTPEVMNKAITLLMETPLRTQKLTPLAEKLKLMAQGEDAERALGVPAAAIPTMLTRIEKRDKKRIACLNAFAESNLRLVVSVVKHFQGQGLSLADLVNEGNIGLMVACEKYEWRLNYRFSTYAIKWIRQRACRAVGEQSRLIRLPTHINDTAKRVKRVWGRLTATLGREPSVDELAAATNCMPDDVRLVMGQSDPSSLDAESNAREDETVGDELSDQRECDPADGAELSETQRAVRLAVDALPYRERMALHLRFGLGDGAEYTQDEVGYIMGISRPAAQTLEYDAVARMRDPAFPVKLPVQEQDEPDEEVEEK